MVDVASHRAQRPRRRRGSVVLATVALLAGLLLGGTQGSYAFWSDSDDVVAGTFTTGTLDLTVDGQQGAPTAYAETELSLAKMVPGESVAATLTIRNAGDAPFTWVPTITETGFLAPHLDVTMTLGTTAGPVDTVYPRTQTSDAGGTPLASGATLPSLPVGAERTLCVVVSLPSTAGNGVQGRPAGDYTLSLRLAATQTLS